MSNSKKTANSLRKIPSVDQLLRTQELAPLRDAIGVKRLTAIARVVTNQIRNEISANGNDMSTDALLDHAVERIVSASERDRSSGIRHVINATGVVLHTNLGRAPLSEASQKAIVEASRYCTLEYDPFTGTRGTRGSRVELLLTALTGAEDALVVNNCAAAALLVLTELAKDGETIVSRGELVEIGGDFRVPDVMSTSGTQMIEIGTTNKTHLEDYRRAINNRTRLIMRVHPSNYRIVGFTGTPSLSDLAALSREFDLPLYVDAGSGQMSETSRLEDEPSVAAVIKKGADIVTFSGDKLLGSVQAGLIVGRRQIVSRLRKHPLYRALRSDKIRMAALSATLEAHERETAQDRVPTSRMLALTVDEISSRAESLVAQLGNSGLILEIVPGESAVGGGAAPTSSLPTALIGVAHKKMSAGEIDHELRFNSIPIISRIAEGRVLLDLRTVFDDEEPTLISALRKLSKMSETQA